MTRPRLDPRALREARRVSGGERPRYQLAAVTLDAGASPFGSPFGRRRRNPRTETLAQAVPSPASRPRLDRAWQGGASSTASPAARMQETAPRIRIIEDPAFLILAVPDAAGGRLSPHDRQILGAARTLADKAGSAGQGAVVLFGPPLADAGDNGADRLIQCEDDSVESRAAALAAAIAHLHPKHVLFPESPDGGDLARRVAALSGLDIATDIEALSASQAIRPSHARRREQRMVPPPLLALSADRAAPHTGIRHEARPIPLELPQVEASALTGWRDIPPDAGKLALTEASFVVSAGNGITDFATFHALTAALGATPGASRVICDAGLMPRDRQVGATGSILDATCYFALGIAGAPQHLQGVAGVEHVVAVNTDLHAAMIARAGLAIVADAQDIMPAILAALAAERDASRERVNPDDHSPGRETP
ncbi:Electron transfer flavoprotein alpha-subunit [Granulibacter bethesdensis]|uniref:Electron transfer flavoprotein alpha-subunit n=1 Tax=Granulibacter bethesdensis TaxID=364410 RepID=A0AAC9KC98_9PROT|nr:electron transfer flavoprotein subunit alpha/FixB family protein [Granulibacter bethesdensis]APH53295.1 Electron transfer flavoprotein alpha-subunit [Granulibacter bethesdensis]APH60870.1 Electron transfer flavoprotein alpha-subunit [Granulibacter bethesdensis]